MKVSQINKRYLLWTALLILVLYVLVSWWMGYGSDEGYELASQSNTMLAHDATHQRPLRGTLPTGTYTMSMALYDGAESDPRLGGDVSGHLYTVSTDGKVTISDARAPAPLPLVTQVPTGPPMACYPITPLNPSGTPSPYTPSIQGFTTMVREGLTTDTGSYASGTTPASTYTTGSYASRTTPAGTPTGTTPTGASVSKILDSAPKDATVDTFYIDFFNADNGNMYLWKGSA